MAFDAQRHAFKALQQTFIVDQDYIFHKELGQGAYGLVVAAKNRRTGEGCAIKKITNIGTKITCLYDMDIVFEPNGVFNEVYLYVSLIILILRLPRHTTFRFVFLMALRLTNTSKQEELMEADLHAIYIHSANVLHRDLKPGNILLNADCELKICDFGLARGYTPPGQNPGPASKAAGSAGFMTEYVATRWYRAPEIMLSFANYSTSIDIWSVGCILAECLGGKPIFRGRDYVDQLSQILNCLGTPKEDALRRVGSPRAQDYIRSLPIKPRIPFQQLYPSANPLAIDLLSRMLCFDPQQRIACEEALKHQYLSVWHDPMDEPSCEKKFDFSFEEEDTIEGMKKLIVEEVAQFRQEVRGQSSRGGGPKRQDTLPIPSREEIINSPVHENAPADGATSGYTRSADGRAGSPMMEDPATELENELATKMAQ
ncbi:Mitogen-activated protein kinase [Serendipita sp. 399]|nr:Mitogen-activated protein kinase [Serendipita sp. 399]